MASALSLVSAGVPANAQSPPETIPSPFPTFTPAPDADHSFGEPVTNDYSGSDYTVTLDPGQLTRTHVNFDDGTLAPTRNSAGINISNDTDDTEYHAITLGSDAQINLTGGFAANISTENNQGNLRIFNKGDIAIASGGMGLRALLKKSPADILLVNDGKIELSGLKAPSGSKTPNYRLVIGSLNKAAEPHDFTNYSHKVELLNMPSGRLIATGPYNGRIDGLKVETGGGHLTRLVNYSEGLIQIEGESARGMSAQSLWGASQAHNYGTITMNGLYAIGIHAGNCAPWPEDDNGCHENLGEVFPNRTTNVPGDVYARNYSTGIVVTRANTRQDDTRAHRKAYGIHARTSNAGRTFAINEGSVSTEGRESHGIYAHGYENARDLDDAGFPSLSDYPDTSDHDAVYVANTGTITTDGQAADGIRAEHHRGGNITVFNSGTIVVTNEESTVTRYSSGISVTAHTETVPGSGCATAAGAPVDPNLPCVGVGRVGNVVIKNTGIVKSPEGGTEPPDIGIDVISEGGDVTITHTGSVEAADIGVRVKTSGQGTVTLHLKSTLNAPTRVQVTGVPDSQISLVSSPTFLEGASATRMVAENIPSGQVVGTAIQAIDVDGDELAYSLGGTDANSFTLDPTTGQLRTSAPLHYETKSSYTVSVTVSDSNATAEIEVTIVVTNVDEDGTVTLSLNQESIGEAGPTRTVTVTGTLNQAPRSTATTMAVTVGGNDDAAMEGLDYQTVEELTLTIPARSESGTARFTLNPSNDRIVEGDEALTVRGATGAIGLTVTPTQPLTIRIEDDDPLPSLALSASPSRVEENGGMVSVTVSTGSGSTFETAQTVQLSVAGTATETTDYTISGKRLTLPAGMGTSASMVSATLTGVDDDVDDDDETVVVWGTHNAVAFGDRRTVTIDDDDDPEVTVSFSQAEYRAAEGGHVDVAVTLSAVPERQVSIPVEAEGAAGAESADFSISPSSLSFGANETTKTVRVSAANDSAVDPGENVALSFRTPLPDRVSEGSTAQATVTIRDEDFTFVPAFAAASGTTEQETGVFAADEDDGVLRLTLGLTTPRGVRVEDIPDPLVVTLATRENAGIREADEDYATQRRSGTFGDYGGYSRDLSFAPADFSDDSTCGCATAEKSVSVDLFNDRVYERTEVFGLRLTRKSGRLSVSSQDITVKIGEDDAEPALTLGIDPATIAEAGGVSTVTVSTGTGSTFPTAQTIDLELSGTATEDSDFEIDAQRLTLPAGTGTDTSSVTTTVRGMDDAIDDDAETIVLSATRDGAAFANRTLTITDDDAGSTRVDLAANPAQVREDAASATVRVTASLNAGARAGDTEVSVTVGSAGDSADEGTDYQTIGVLTLTIDAGETEAGTTFTLRPTNDDTAEGAERITVDGNVSGLAVRAATLTLNDDDVESTEVALTLDPDEVGEAVGSRAVRITGTLNGSALTTNTLVVVTVGSASDTAVEGTDYTEVGELELSIPANRTDGSVIFTLRPTNDATAEGEETISVSGHTAGLTVVPAQLVLADNDAVSTRLHLSLNPARVSEGAVPTGVTVTGTLDAGARETETLVTVTVGAPADSAVSDTDYVAVSNRTLTIPANETRAGTTFTLTPEDDAVAEGAESITVGGSVSGLMVEVAALTLSDDDTASRVVMLAADPPSVREDTPEQVTVTAGLDAAARVEDTTVRLTVGAAGDTAVPGTDYRRVDDRELTILAGETAATATFFLEPVDNQSADGARALRVTGTTPAADLRVEPAAGARIELEDDDVPAVLVMPAELTVTEAASADYRVALQTAPTVDVTVAITGVSGDLSLNKTSLVFTPGDFDVAQTVSVMAADDDDNTQDADVTLTHRASGAAEYRGLSAELVVSIRENDPSLLFSKTAVSVPEGGSETYSVALAIEPTGTVTVSISGVSGDLSLDMKELYFARGNWELVQTVTVEATEDDDSSTDPAVTLTHRASGGGYDGIVGNLRVSVTENDGGGGTGGGGGGGGGAANHPPVVEREIEDQTLEVGEVLELDIRLNFYDRDQRALDYTVESADPSVATVEVDRNGLLTMRGMRRGVTAIAVSAADRRGERASDTFAVTVKGAALVALVPRASDPMREGFVRVINHAAEAGEVSIEAIDDTGVRLGPVTLSIEAGETVHFNSGDLEDGNAAKGLPEGVGSGAGDWRLILDSDLNFDVLSYIRTDDGFLTAMHDTVPIRDGAYRVAIFNPGSNANQVSRLRLINPGDAAAEVTVTGVDDRGATPGTSVMFEVPAGESLTLAASDLEAGAGVGGALGDGTGKWRLRVTSDEPIVAMSLLSSPTGHLTNLSTVPRTPEDEDDVHVVPLFPSASDPLGRQGFVRVVNRSGKAGEVMIAAHDDSEIAYDDVTLTIGAGATVHFNSNDLELGNAAKGLSGSTGAGVGDWRLVLSSELDIQVLAYIRTSDGFLTSMHDVAPGLEGVHRIVIFNPGSNPNQVSGLRLVNPGSEDAEVTIAGVDDAGASPGSAVVLTVPAGGSRTIRAAEVESGGEGLSGALGDGVGKWRLRVASEEPIVVMSLLSSPTGHLTNLSTAPRGGGT